MENANKKYTDDQITLLSGKIQGTPYLEEVKGQLAKAGKAYSDGYIHRVIASFSYNNDIWDAAKEVIKERRRLQEQNAAELKQLVSEGAV